jgi:hypothetical protein
MVLMAVTLGTAACDLDVANLNQPDRDRALSEPWDVEALVGGTFAVFFNAMHGRGLAVNYFPTAASEMTTTTPNGRAVQLAREPRGPYPVDLSLGSTGEWGPREVWWDLNEVAAGAHDGLSLINAGMSFRDGTVDTTPRARAFAKLMQGIAWGYQAMIYDQAVIIPETEPIRSDPGAQGREALTPRSEALQIALGSLDEAIQIASQNSINFPTFPSSRLWFGLSEPMGSEKFIQLANTMAARLIVLSARTPQERAQLDWNRVLQYTANGLTTDFEIVLAAGFRTSTLFARIQANTVGCANCLRMDYRLIGWSDTSGRYQDWISRPYGDRDRFDIVTPDRRITGESPQSHGAYFRYRADNNGFSAELPLFSAYQWARHAHKMNDSGTASNQGNAVIASADENRLLRAEALLHTGDLPGAAELVNVTRTRSHTLPNGQSYDGLPPVTAAGVPQSADCVPRTDAGACGDLLVALRYERMIELVGLDLVRGWADGRGFGILADGTWLMLPVAPEDLRLFDVPTYTFGGVGTEWGAVYSPVTLN